jgi:hypothetical protein
MSILVIQMGHAGRTSGATGAPGEQAYTQRVGAACARLLNRSGWTVRLIVADPPAAQYRGDAFVAIHADGSTNPAVRGASVGYQNPEGGALAAAWKAAYPRRGFSGPWHPDNYTANLKGYYGVAAARAQDTKRACIIECGTITNAEDRALMDPDRVALAIGDALGITGLEQTAMGFFDEGKNAEVAARRLEALMTGANTTGGPVPEDVWINQNVKKLAADVAELKALITGLVGDGVALRASGEITVKAEQA